MSYIEDILHYYVDTVKITDKDTPILSSISTQVKRGLALTDRQYELVKNKLFEKQDVLIDHKIIVDQNLDTRLPLRQIDRSKYIKLVNTAEVYVDSVYESHKEDWVWIKIRFPFEKKTIVLLENISRGRHTEYVHPKGSHEHYFKLTGKTAIEVVNTFKNKNFEIDEDLISYANKAQDIIENKHNYTPTIVDDHVTNIKDKLVELIDNDCDGMSNLLLKDRSIRYGLTYKHEEPVSLSETIAYRNQPEVLVKPDTFNVNDIVSSLNELNRFPIIIAVDESECFDQVYEFYRAFNGIVPNEEQSVLFRVDAGDKNEDLNEFVKTHSLNNWVDKNTKIVYIKKNKLPKVLLKSEFVPKTALCKTSIRSTSHVNAWINFNCDLIVYHDTSLSNFRTYYKGFSGWQVVN